MVSINTRGAVLLGAAFLLTTAARVEGGPPRPESSYRGLLLTKADDYEIYLNPFLRCQEQKSSGLRAWAARPVHWVYLDLVLNPAWKLPEGAGLDRFFLEALLPAAQAAVAQPCRLQPAPITSVTVNLHFDGYENPLHAQRFSTAVNVGAIAAILLGPKEAWSLQVRDFKSIAEVEAALAVRQKEQRAHDERMRLEAKEEEARRAQQNQKPRDTSGPSTATVEFGQSAPKARETGKRKPDEARLAQVFHKSDSTLRHVEVCNRGKLDVAVAVLNTYDELGQERWAYRSWVRVPAPQFTAPNCEGVTFMNGGYSHLVFAVLGEDQRLGVVRYTKEPSSIPAARKIRSVCISDKVVDERGAGTPSKYLPPCPAGFFEAPVSETAYTQDGFLGAQKSLILRVEPAADEKALFTIWNGKRVEWRP